MKKRGRDAGIRRKTMITVHDIRARLAQDKPTVGTWLQIPSPDVAELMARAGYDWVAVDMEHGSFSPAFRPSSRSDETEHQVCAGGRRTGPHFPDDREP